MKFKLNESNIPFAREVVDEHFSWAQEELGDASPAEYVQFFKDIASEAYTELDEDDLIDAVLDYYGRNVTEPLPEALEEASSGTTVYRAEYYEPKLDKWISYYENNSLDAVKSNLDNPIIGDPKKRIAQYQKSGVRKPSYKLVSILTEGIDPTKAQEYRKESDADVIFYGYQYKNEKPVEIEPEELSYDEYQARKNQIVNSFNKLYNDKPTANRYGKEHDIMFYALYNKKNEALNEWYPNDVEEIELEYNDIDLDDDIVDWTYSVDKEDLYTYIFESCITEEDFPTAFEDTFDPNNDEDWKLFVNWIEENFSDIYSKYETNILEHYRDLATDQALENYDPDDYVDWDSMPGGHDDY